MKSISFILKEDTDIWEYEKFQLYLIEDSQWVLTINKKSQVYETIYDVLEKLTSMGFHPLFRLPVSMENVKSKFRSA